MLDILLITSAIVVLCMYIELHKKISVLEKELLKVTHETGYKLWNLERKFYYEREDNI